MMQHDRHLQFTPLDMRPEAPERVPRVPFELKARLPLTVAHDHDTLMMAIDLVRHHEACGVYCTESAAKSVSVCFSKLRGIEARYEGAIKPLPFAFLAIMAVSGEPSSILSTIFTASFWATWFKKGGTSLVTRFVRDRLIRQGSLRDVVELPYGELCIAMWREGWGITRNREKSLIVAPREAVIPIEEPPTPSSDAVTPGSVTSRR